MDRTEKNRNQLPTNLPQLQNLIKRDSPLYKDEFLQQFAHYKSLCQLFMINPAQPSPRLEKLVMFLSQVCCCYPTDMETFPSELMELLKQHSQILHPDVRLSLCRGLILMRNKNFIQPQSLLELFFELFRCQDKVLRMLLYNHIVADIKKINSKHKNNKVNKGLQSFMYTMLADSSSMAARMSLDVIIEMYKKNIWNDSKTVNVISTACFSSVSKLVSTALKFFLSGEDSNESDDSSDESEDESNAAMRKLIITKQVTKRGKKQKRKMEKALSMMKKQKKKSKGPKQASFSALHLLNDPQDFSEKLFKVLEKTREKFPIRLMMMSLISRLIGLHQLFVFNFYPYLQRYLLPHQRDVTKILTFFAQSCHEMVPPEVIRPTLTAVVHNFISERNSSEVIVVGLNTVREACIRCPLVMEKDLLQDLVGYKSYKDKGVMMAARSLIQLFRNIQPDMLHKKDRGKPMEAVAGAVVKGYGEVQSNTTVPGTELLDLESDQPSDEESESDDSDGEWIDINHQGDGSDNDIHELELESEDESDEWVECESETEESDSETTEFIEDREGDTSCHDNSELTNQKPAKRVRFATGKEAAKLTLKEFQEQRKQKAEDITQTRLLTQQEFKAIREKQLSAQLAPRRGIKRQLDVMLNQQAERREGAGELLPEEAINSLDHVRRKADKKARIESIKSGREDREKFGRRRHKLNPHSSTTNKQKAKKKAFMMQKQKRNVRTKSKASFREKQMALRKSLLKQKKRK